MSSSALCGVFLLCHVMGQTAPCCPTFSDAKIDEQVQVHILWILYIRLFSNFISIYSRTMWITQYLYVITRSPFIINKNTLIFILLENYQWAIIKFTHTYASGFFSIAHFTGVSWPMHCWRLNLNYEMFCVSTCTGFLHVDQ